MKFASYWHDTAPAFTGAAPGPASGDYEVAVIGAGFTGLNAARSLAKAGRKVVVLEAEHVGYGASGRNGGHINSGLAYSYGAACRQLGEATARRLWQAHDAGIDLIEAIVEEEGIDCDFRRAGKLKLASKPAHVASVRAMGEEIRRQIDPGVSWVPREALAGEVVSEAFHGAVLYPRSAMMHMGRYVHGLATATVRHGAVVHERSAVVAREKVANGWRLRTADGAVTARQVVLATDAYTTGVFPYFRRRMFPIASFIIATRPLSEAEVAATLPGDRTYVNSLNIANYFRLSPDRRLVFGGRARFSAESNQRSDTLSGQRLRAQMLGMFPQLESVAIDYCWGGLVGCTQDRYPRVGQADGVIYGMGYSGHGTHMSNLVGTVLADIALGKHGTNPCEGMAWDAVPLHTGKPWFLPIVGAYYALKDKYC